jgi:hypothetical protein
MHGTAVCKLSIDRPVRVVGFMREKVGSQLFMVFGRGLAAADC